MMSAKTARRLVQSGVFALFFFLFLNTEYKDSDQLPYAVNIFLRFDPLMGWAAALADRSFIWLMWPSLLMAALTLIFGRFFCGWICPLGSVLDFSGLFFGKKRRGVSNQKALRNAKFGILALLAGSSLFTLQLVFLFDPLCILIRSLALSLYPAANLALNAFFGSLYESGPGAVTAVSEPAYAFLKSHFLSFQQPYYRLAALTGFVFFSVIALEYAQKRFWCRNLCPLGALLGLLGMMNPFKRRVREDLCTSCGACARVCSTGAVGEGFASTQTAECVACLECKSACPEKAISFAGAVKPEAQPPDAGRRALLGSLAIGAFSASIFASDAKARYADPARIRPPGALPEDEFLARCTRCGECMRVCIANGLQPAIGEAGPLGLWSPVLVPKIGYCEYNCTLCGQVCPTGAIKRLPVEEKRQVRIGLAYFDRNRCLPWNGTSECIVCEEHCPVPQKAIKLKEDPLEGKTFKKPFIDEKLCIGCGICETKCPLTDGAAIRVTSRGESRAEKE